VFKRNFGEFFQTRKTDYATTLQEIGILVSQETVTKETKSQNSFMYFKRPH
jgi:hypothetical protein